MAAGRVIQNLLLAAGLSGNGAGCCRPGLGGHEQLIRLRQLFWQQSIKLIFQP
jgi:hypothetical protein